MSLNKKSMVREIGRRTRLKNRDVQAVIETLIEVWTEELVAGGRIEIEGFCTFNVQQRDRLDPSSNRVQSHSRVRVAIGRQLKLRLRQ